MKYVVVINSKETETVWNAFRFAVAVLARGHKASVFLMGSAVEIDDINDAKFNVEKLFNRFEDLGGEAFSCDTCLTIRGKQANFFSPVSSMDELVRLTEEADRTVVFG